MTVQTKIVLQGDPSGAVAAINRVRTELGALQSVGSKALSFGGAIAGSAAVAGLVAVTKSAIDAADALDELSIRTGVSVEDLSKLQYATTVLGVDQEKLQKGLVRLNAEIASAGAGNQAAAERFQSLGVDVREADGRIRGALPVFLDLAEAISQLPEGAARTNAAIGIFGEKVGKDMVLAIDGGREALQELFDELERSGGVVSSDFAKQAGKFNESLDRMRGLASSAGIAIGSELIPSLNKFLEKILAAKNSGIGVAGVLEAMLGRSPLDAIKSNRELADRATADIDRLQRKIASFREKNRADDVDALYELDRLVKLREYYRRAADVDEGKTDAQDNAATRLRLQRQLQVDLAKLERLRAVASGAADRDILDSDAKRTEAQIKSAEKLRDALKSAWQSSIDGAKKASEEAQSMLAAAVEARASGARSAEDVRRQQMSPEDQAFLNARDLRQAQAEATNAGLLAKLAAQQGRTDNAARLAEQAIRAAEETLRLADKAGDPETRARAIEAASEARAAALEAQARLKQDESARLEERAAGQQAMIAELEQKLAALQAQAAALSVEVDITQAEGSIAEIQARLDALQDKTITVTVNQVTTSGEGAPAEGNGTTTGFARGGWTGPGGKWQPAGIVHAGEFVTRQEIVRQPGALAFLAQFNRVGMDALRRVLPGFAGGGLVNQLRSTPLIDPSGPGRRQAAAVFNFPGVGRYPATLDGYDFDRLQADFARAALQKGARR